MCELLPYLLIAYTFNSQRSHFFNRQERDKVQDTYLGSPRRFFQIFSSDPIIPDEASKIRALTPGFAKNFSLRGYKNPLSNASKDELSDYRSADIAAYLLGGQKCFYMKGVSDFKYLSLLNTSFERWCRILQDCNRKFGDSSFDLGIDYRKSLLLYNYYTNQNLPLMDNGCGPDVYASFRNRA